MAGLEKHWLTEVLRAGGWRRENAIALMRHMLVLAIGSPDTICEWLDISHSTYRRLFLEEADLGHDADAIRRRYRRLVKDEKKMTWQTVEVLAGVAVLALGCRAPPSSAAAGDCGRVEAARCPPCPACADAGPSPGSAGDAGGPEALACANLARLGCSEGADSACAFEMRRAEADRMTVVPIACLAAASSPAAAVRCGFVKCLPDGGR